MTYLQLINSVLRKLREDEVTTSAESDYSKLIGDFINDALSNVERLGTGVFLGQLIR